MISHLQIISVVILSHNRLKELKQNLLDWCENRTSNLELVVVDNGSSDGSAEFLRQLDAAGKIRAICLEHNVGVAAGRNTGFRVVKGEIILCLDDDAYLLPTEVDKIIRYFQEDATLGVLSLSVIHAVTGEKQNPHGNKTIEIANYHGAAHAFRAEALREIGYLDEQCIFGGEELDSCIRLYEKGYHCWYTPEIVALHNSFYRQGGIGLSRSCQWVYNYARVLFKNFPSRMAGLYANRLLMTHLFHGLKRFGVTGAFEIISADYRGRRKGKEQYQPVSDRTVRFYSNPDLRPEFGNVAISKKVLRRIGGRG
jgi:GT2 family glycosyltransferase